MWDGIGHRLASPKPIGEGRSISEGMPNVGGFVRCIIPPMRDAGGIWFIKGREGLAIQLIYFRIFNLGNFDFKLNRA